ncbi:MAG: hypothetical protein WKF52_05230 [Sphingomicrobium sp.]
MRAELGALTGRQRLFEQGAEDRRLDILPFMLGRRQQLAALCAGQLIDFGIGEQADVEILYRVLEREGPAVGEVRLAHFLPQVGEPAREAVVVAQGALEKSLERALVGIVGQQLRIFSEHAEQDAHQEQAGFLKRLRMLPVGGGCAFLQALRFFQPAADRSEATRDVAGDVRRDQARVEAPGVSPDHPQQIERTELERTPRLVLRKGRDRQAIGGAVGEEAIVAAVAAVVEVKLERAADIENDDERRPRRLGQAMGIAARLPESAPHQLVIFTCRRRNRRIEADRTRNLTYFALLGFKDEAPGRIHVDVARTAGLRAAGNRCVDSKVARGIGRRDTQDARQLRQKYRIIGPLAARAVFPLGNEFFDRHAPSIRAARPCHLRPALRKRSDSPRAIFRCPTGAFLCDGAAWPWSCPELSPTPLSPTPLPGYSTFSGANLRRYREHWEHSRVRGPFQLCWLPSP